MTILGRPSPLMSAMACRSSHSFSRSWTTWPREVALAVVFKPAEADFTVGSNQVGHAVAGQVDRRDAVGVVVSALRQVFGQSDQLCHAFTSVVLFGAAKLAARVR